MNSFTLLVGVVGLASVALIARRKAPPGGEKLRTSTAMDPVGSLDNGGRSLGNGIAVPAVSKELRQWTSTSQTGVSLHLACGSFFVILHPLMAERYLGGRDMEVLERCLQGAALEATRGSSCPDYLQAVCPLFPLLDDAAGELLEAMVSPAPSGIGTHQTRMAEGESAELEMRLARLRQSGRNSVDKMGLLRDCLAYSMRIEVDRAARNVPVESHVDAVIAGINGYLSPREEIFSFSTRLNRFHRYERNPAVHELFGIDTARRAQGVLKDGTYLLQLLRLWTALERSSSEQDAFPES